MTSTHQLIGQYLPSFTKGVRIGVSSAFVRIYTSSNFRARAATSAFLGWIGVFGAVNSDILIWTGPSGGSPAPNRCAYKLGTDFGTMRTVIIAPAHCLHVRLEKPQ